MECAEFSTDARLLIACEGKILMDGERHKLGTN